MPEMTFKEAVKLALIEEMESDESVYLMGEDIGVYGGAFGVTSGLLERFGPDRVVETPISESSLMGIATGSAIMGLRPVFEIMFMDFCTLIVDQLLNHAVKFNYIFGKCNDVTVPVVIRTPFGGGRAYGASHSQSLEGLFLSVPGLKIVAPSNPADARNLLKASIRDDGPVMFLENKLLYNLKGEVNREKKQIPQLGKGARIRSGEDLTMVSYGRTLYICEETARHLNREGWTVDVIDLRTLRPLDVELLKNSVEKTGRLVVVEEGPLTGGIGAEVVSRVMESCFFSLEAPPARVAALDVPIPFSPNLESAVLPDTNKIIRAALKTLAY